MAALETSQSSATPEDGQSRTLARDYSMLWQRRPQTLEAFLAQHQDVSGAELAAVARVDLRERWRSGQRPTAEEYLGRFPQLAAAEESAVDMIYAEFLAREKLSEHPTVAEYAARFPQYSTVLADQIQLHQAFDETMSGQPTVGETERNLPADYEILEEIGRGGMGVVYRARQTGLNRLVALKMVRHADLANDELLSRFRAEAEVVASLHHPHIVQVYDYGEHDGCPYLALELVEGGTLADRLEGNPWNVRRAAQLVEQVARAVHFAHEHGVVHRDLKPNNLLVSADGNPPEVKIADFGLARVFRDQPGGHTQTGALLGTPSYMAPEQAFGRQSEIGPATDVYALGAILYELLCGRPPYRGETAIETLQQVLLAEPASIYRVAPGLPRDLATICSKCLERAPTRRYPTALALAEDLQRFLADRPIEARPATNLERGWRWCRRNPALAASLGSVALLLLAVSIVSTWYSGKLSRQLEITMRAELAERAANEAAQVRLWDAYLAEIAARNSSRQMGQRFAALETIDRARRLLPAIGTTDDRQLQLRNAAIRSLALPDLRRVREVWSSPQLLEHAAIALAANRLALKLRGTLLVVEAEAGKVLASAMHQIPDGLVSISPDGRFVALTGERGTQLWRVTAHSVEALWHDAALSTFSFAPDGKHAVVQRNPGGLLVVDAENGNLVRPLVEQHPSSQCWFHQPSDRLAVYVGTEALIIDWKTGAIETRVPLGDFVNVQMAWHPGGESLAIWASSNPITIWNLSTGKVILTLPQRSFPQQMLFNADGSRLVSCGLWDSRLMLWDVGTGQKEFEVQGFDNLAMDLDAAGNLGLLKYDRKRLEQWELAGGSECRLLPSAWFPTTGGRTYASISPDNRLLVVSGERSIEVWDLAKLERVSLRPSAHGVVQFDRRGDLIMAVDTMIYRWPRQDQVRAGKKVVSFGPPVHISETADPYSLATCIPNERLLFETVGGWCTLPLTGDRKPVALRPPGDPRKAALTRDGQLAAIASWETGGATVWNANTGAQVATLATGRWGMVEFSPDGRWLASTPDGVKLWRSSDWSLAQELRAQGTTPHGLGIAFSPDSRVLAVGQTSCELRLVDPQSGQDWARLAHSAPDLSSIMAFTSDNRKLVCLPTDQDAQIRVWNLAEIRRSLAEFELDWPADVLKIAPEANDDAMDVEIEWKDAGFTLFQNAIKAFRDTSSRKSASNSGMAANCRHRFL